MTFPFWSTVGRAYQVTWNHKWDYVRLSWRWLSFAFPLILFLEFFFTFPLCLKNHTSSLTSLAPFSKEVLFPYVILIVKVFCFAPVAVAWHRLIVHGERSKAPGYFISEKTVWVYFFIGLLLLLIPDILSLGMWESFDQNPVRFLSMGLLSFILFFYMCRFSVILPAIAVGSSEASFGHVLRRTAGNGWRIFFGGFLCSLIYIPAFLIFFVIPLLLNPSFVSDICNPYSFLLGSFFSLITLVVCGPVSLTFLSLVYQALFTKHETTSV